jgi:choline dehydrogenase-like flavoprotein
MTKTFIPRALATGAELIPNTRVDRLSREGSGWIASVTKMDGAKAAVHADHVFVCGGAVQTPALLRRSGITENVGNSLQLHPTAKLVAAFPDDVNSLDMGVPVHQVKEFAPRISFGCSISSVPYLALAMMDHPAYGAEIANWRKMAIYYAMITPEGSGSVRPVIGFKDPLVRYALKSGDLRALAEGMRRLSKLLFAAGATAVFPAAGGNLPILRGVDHLQRLPNMLDPARTNLMTIHLFSSCPMGENRRKCAADSFGRLFEEKGLYISDGSLLCTAPGVNPQGSIMAFARRNALKFLGRL